MGAGPGSFTCAPMSRLPPSRRSTLKICTIAARSTQHDAIWPHRWQSFRCRPEGSPSPRPGTKFVPCRSPIKLQQPCPLYTRDALACTPGPPRLASEADLSQNSGHRGITYCSVVTVAASTQTICIISLSYVPASQSQLGPRAQPPIVSPPAERERQKSWHIYKKNHVFRTRPAYFVSGSSPFGLSVFASRIVVGSHACATNNLTGSGCSPSCTSARCLPSLS
jgi:hypothetical protein